MLFKQKLKLEGLSKGSDLDTVIKELKEKITNRKAKSLKYVEEIRRGNTNVVVEDGMHVEEVEELISSLEIEKINLIDKRRSRVSRKQALSKRKSYASKERMRILTQLAKSGNTSVKMNKQGGYLWNERRRLGCL